MLKWNMNFRPRFERSNSKCPSYYGCSIPAVEGKLPSVTIEDRYYGCFDHVYLTPLQWLWGQVFLAPNAFALMSVGVSRLWIRRHLQSRGLINPSVEYKKLLFRFIMNTSCAINIKFVDNTKMLARFVFTNLPVYRQDLGSFDIADELIIDLDLREEECVKSTLGNNMLSGADCFVLLVAHFGSVGHVLNHSYGNWGVDLRHPDPYLRTMGIVSVCFNSYGNTDNWLTGVGTNGGAGGEKSNFANLVRHVDNIGVKCHRGIKDLAPYSEFVTFLLKIRRHFYKEFEKYKNGDFRNISAEGLFQGTIMHSLDHDQACKIWKDPLWATPTSKEYKGMALVAQVGRAGFGEELPGLLFQTKFKDSPHPFFQDVYKMAKSINKSLADSMETCMVR